jgi:hypothetical protein
LANAGSYILRAAEFQALQGTDELQVLQSASREFAYGQVGEIQTKHVDLADVKRLEPSLPAGGKRGDFGIHHIDVEAMAPGEGRATTQFGVKPICGFGSIPGIEVALLG